MGKNNIKYKSLDRFIDNLNNSKYKKMERFINRLWAIFEISARNKVPIFHVANAYVGSNAKVYSNDLSIIGRTKYDRDLEKKVFDLTEKYFDIKNTKNLKYLAKIEGKEFKPIKSDESFLNYLKKNNFVLLEKNDELEDLIGDIDDN